MSRNERILTPVSRGTRRGILSVTLALIGIILLIGCIPIPLREKVVSGEDFRPSVRGDQNIEGLNIGMPREQVELILGKPRLRTDEGRTVGYHLEVKSGIYLIPLCFTATTRQRWYLLRLRYDASNRLREWDIKTEDSNPIWTGVQIPSIVEWEFPQHPTGAQTRASQQ